MEMHSLLRRVCSVLIWLINFAVNRVLGGGAGAASAPSASLGRAIHVPGVQLELLGCCSPPVSAACVSAAAEAGMQDYGERDG